MLLNNGAYFGRNILVRIASSLFIIECMPAFFADLALINALMQRYKEFLDCANKSEDLMTVSIIMMKKMYAQEGFCAYILLEIPR